MERSSNENDEKEGEGHVLVDVGNPPYISSEVCGENQSHGVKKDSQKEDHSEKTLNEERADVTSAEPEASSVGQSDKEVNYSSKSGAIVEYKVKEDVDLDSNIEKDPELFVTFEKRTETNVEAVRGRGQNNCMEKEAELGNENGATDKVNIKEIAESSYIGVEDNTRLSPFKKEVKGSATKMRKRTYPSLAKKRQAANSLPIQMIKHPLLSPCQCNKRKCGDQFSFEMRSHIHDKFWTMNMYDRREWINEYLLYLKPKSRTNNPVSTLHESHRKFFLPNLSGKIEVCRRMFFSTLGFKDEAKFLQNPKLLNKKGMLSRTRKRKCIMSRKNLSAVEEYCKDLTIHHRNVETPGTSNQVIGTAANNQVIIPSGFSLRDMYNDFCSKKCISSFGYHRFRQILELILRGEKVEDSQFADLRDDDESDDDGDEEDNGVTKSKQKKKSPSVKPNVVKKKSQYQKKTQHHLPKTKKKTILKLPMFDEVKNNFLKKRTRKEVFPSSSPNKRYNFRDSISVLTSYCEDNLMDPEIETYEDLINDHHEDTEEVKKTKAIDSTIKKGKSKKKAKKFVDAVKSVKTAKKVKPRKKRKKTPLREAQIEFTESRKKSGSNHPVLPPCKCNFRKCFEKIPENQRWVIHDEFWEMTTKQEKKKWIQKYIMHCKPRSRSNFIKFPRKHLSKKYFFPSEEGSLTSVCQVFFMRTLGYHSNMTIDSVDMGDNGVDVEVVSDEATEIDEPAQKALDTDKTSSDSFSYTENSGGMNENKDLPSKQVTVKELNAETGNIDEGVVCKEENYNSQFDSTMDADGLKTSENDKSLFFTPEIEKEEVEKAVNPAIRRRRPLSLRNSKEHHPMGEPCRCSKKCPEKIPQDRRQAIHEHYWSLITYNQRKQWILEHIKREVPKRRTVLTGPVRKKETRKCYLPDWDDSKIEVCRGFFLSTLGFKWDKMIDTICKTTPQDSKYVRADQRGRRAPVHKLSDDIIDCMREYLESILQTIPYIPPQPRDPLKSGGSKKKKNKSPTPIQSGLTIKTLYADYKAKHPNQKVSYASFRKIHCEVRDLYKPQDSMFEDDHEEDGVDSAPTQIPDSHHHSDMSASPGSDNGFTYDANNVPPDPRRINPNSTIIPPLQSCMYNDQPQLLNLSHPDSISKNSHIHNDGTNRVGPGGVKFSKAQDFHHLLPFSTTSSKGHSMYQIPSLSHSSTANMPQYSSGQNNPLDPFYMASSSQAVPNSITYPNLHFPTDLISHPHLHPHHPAHHHPHLYQSALPYRDHNRFPSSILPQALKEHDHNHHFYTSPAMDFVQDHHQGGQDNTIYPFKDSLTYASFTSDNVTHSPAPNQIPNQLSSYPANNVNNLLEQRNSNSNQGLTGGSFVENPLNANACPAPYIKVTDNESLEYISGEGTSEQVADKDPKKQEEDDKKVKKKPNRKRKRNDGAPKVKRIRKVRPLSNRNSKEHHPMLPPCTCGKKCFEKISQDKRVEIYEAFWELGCYNNRKQWIAEHMKREDPKRRTNLESPVMRKKETRRFTLLNSSDEMVEVCRLFFLHTLGLKWDKIIGTICKTTARDEHTVPPDMRGKKPPAHKLNEEVARSVESYARALLQAGKPDFLVNLQQPDNPKKFTLDTYIPYGLTMKNLHQDYKAKHTSHKVSYESFRKIFRLIRRSVLDPDSVDAEEKDDNCTGRDSGDPEGMQGTINAATGHIDTTTTTTSSTDDDRFRLTIFNLSQK